MEIRRLTSADLPEFQQLVASAGWNQSTTDLQRLLNLEPDGCFAAFADTQLVGTITTTTFGQKLAWIGMVLVEPAFRNRGIATALMNHALEYLIKRGVATIKLDATPAGRPVYSRLGFVEESQLERWMRPPCTPATLSRESFPPTLAAEFFELDRNAFGADRQRMLVEILAAPGTSLSAEVQPTGFALRRQGRIADYIGPVIAKTPELAERLLRALCETDHALIVDVFADHPLVPQSLLTLGFQKQRDLLRMRLGHDSRLSKSSEILAIAGPEVG